MADSAVAITAGSGTNVDTRTEGTNSDHRQVVVIGDPATNAGVAPVDVTKGLAVQAVSGGIASGAIASGAIASGAIAAGAIATGATSIAANEDDASANADTGVKILAVRKATPANTSGTDGDYEMLQMSAGRLWVDGSGVTLTVGSHAVTNAGTFAVQDATLEGAIKNEDVASANADPMMVVGVKRSDTPAATSGTDGDYEPLQVTGGKLWVTGAYKEDTASADADPIVVAGAKRTDTPANSSGTDGDYEPLQVSGGFLWVRNTSKFVTASTDVTRPADTTAYTADDAWSDSTSAPTSGGYTLSSVVRASGGAGIITDMWFCSTNMATTKLVAECWLFETSVTNINDNTAFAISDAECKTVVAVVPFTMTKASSNNDAAHVWNLNIGFTASGSSNLRFLIKVKNGYTPASAEVLTTKIKVLTID